MFEIEIERARCKEIRNPAGYIRRIMEAPCKPDMLTSRWSLTLVIVESVAKFLELGHAFCPLSHSFAIYQWQRYKLVIHSSRNHGICLDDHGRYIRGMK